MSEIPVHFRPRRLADWINPTGTKKVHSLVDKVYKRKNLEMAWEKVKANRGSGGVEGQTLETFEAQLEQQLERLHRELREETYQPLPVRQHRIPKQGKPGEFRMLGIPAIYDRVCQQALLNQLEPIFEPLFDDASFGYRRGRSTKDAMRKVWKEIDGGREWIVDGDLKDFFGSVDHEKLLTLIAQRVADSRVLRLIKAMLKAGSYGQGKLFPSERGTPQGGIASPLLSNILLTPFDQEMRRKGYQLTRFADDWVITCKSAAEARAALAVATRILERLGVRLNPQKTRIVHIQQGFDFLGYRMVRTSGKSKIPRGMIQRWNPKGLIAYPTRKSIRRFRDRVRMLTRRSAQRKTAAQPQLGISKAGDTMLRKLLVGSAQYILGAFGPDTDLRRYGLRLCERGGKNAKKRAAVAVARKLAVLLHRLWVSGEVYEPLGYRVSRTMVQQAAA